MTARVKWTSWNRLYRSLHLLVNWFLPSQKLLHKVREGSHITKLYHRAQTPCTRMLARMDVPEETKQRLLATRAELDLASLRHEILHCQEQLWTRWPGEDNPWSSKNVAAMRTFPLR